MLPSRLTTLEKLRLDKGVSRKRASVEVPVNRKTLKRLEEGVGEPRTETVAKLASYYGVRPDWLLAQYRQDQFELTYQRAA